ncbi:glycosyltransferase family protein [Nitriliruptor alkaliphilus]|uniref:glycosyltransferase family protein n=1 Tax=Nitriliruptor alkaliphilus TaxID=427918 RepID=UPI000AD725E6|nr:glycosyltransferase [Nitriliruptor alkaliphilus]
MPDLEPDRTGTSDAVDSDEVAASYVLRRLTARRTVRAALALGALRRGPAAARATFRAPIALEHPGPPVGAHQREPHLRVAHLSDLPITDATAPGVRLTAEAWRTQLEIQRPDLVLLDATTSWLDATAVAACRQLTDAPVVATSEVAGALPRGSVDLVVDADDPDGAGAPAVDHRADNPMGVDRRPQVRAVHDDGTREVALSALRAAARGTVVVCAEGSAIERTLGPVAVTAPPDLLDRAAADLAADPDAAERASVRQRRHVLAHHTIDDRARQLLAAAGIRLRPPPRTSVLLATRRADQVAAALAAVTAQSVHDLEVQLLLHGIDVDATALDAGGHRLEVHRVPAQLPLGAVLAIGLDAATGDLIAKMDDDDLYGPGHLADLAVALRYSGADLVGRWANITHLGDDDVTVTPPAGREEVWAHHLPGATMLGHAATFRRLRWRHVPHGVDRELVRALHADGGRAYATHRFGFIRRRHGDHTFAKGDRAFAREGTTTPGLDRSVLDV